MTDAEHEAQIGERCRLGAYGIYHEDVVLLRRLLDEARGRVREGETIVVAQRTEITRLKQVDTIVVRYALKIMKLRDEITRLTATPAASAMAQADRVIDDALAEAKTTGDVIRLRYWIAGAIEQAEREARAAAIEEAAQLCDQDAEYWKAEAIYHFKRKQGTDKAEYEEANRQHEHATAMASHSRLRASAIRALADAPQEKSDG